jgi:glycosyltransferase involved in cell wall biosynthesis
MFVHDGRYNNVWIPDTRHLVHAVFNNYEPHGHVYAYVSEWLFNEALKKKNGRKTSEIEEIRKFTNSPFIISEEIKRDWVPHTVMPKKGDGDYFRKMYNIEKSSFLIGRIGGFTEFSDPIAKRAVVKLLDIERDLVFAFINTKPFILHPRVKYIGYVTESQKWDFYDACDLFLNGRLMGESFGFSIVEPLMLGKPIIAPNISRNLYMDKHHVQILKPVDLLYKSEKHLVKKVRKIMQEPLGNVELQSLVDQFTKEKVRERFISIFFE